MTLVNGHALSVKTASLEFPPPVQSSCCGEHDSQPDDPVPPEGKADTSFECVSTVLAPTKPEDDEQSDGLTPLHGEFRF